LTYWSADYTVAPTLRPKLVVTYTDGSHAVAPSVAVNSPAPNSTVRGNTVSVSVGASDDRRVDKVELLADGTVVGTDTVAPYSFLWDSTTKANGAHTLSAKAYDDAGNTATSTGVPVTVDNNGFPTVSVSPPTAGSYASAVQADAPRAWWRLGESSGTTASDSSGNLLHGSWSGATPGAPGALAHDNNSAGNFSGIENDDVIVNDNDALDFGTSNFTAEAWVKTTVNEERTVMGKYDGGGLTPNWRFTVTDDDGLQGLVRVLLCDGVTVGTYYGPPTRVDDGKWHHVMVAFDRPSGVRIYVDGMERIHTHTVVGSVSNTAPLRIGDSSGYPALQGEIDEPAVYPTALSATRAVAHYDAGVVRNAYTVNATAGDDVGVSKVEFYADDVRFAEDTTAPYSATLDTLAAGNVVYDGTRVLTAKAYDTSGQVTTSASVPRTVGNTAHSKYRASFTTTPVPSTAVYDPALSVQEKAGVDVTVTNTSATTWAQGSVQLRYRWVSQSTVVDAAGTAFPVSVPGGSSVTQRLLIDPPTLDAGTDRKEWRLVFDLFEPATSTWFAAKGNQPIDNPVIVNKVVMAGLGLERFYQYTDDQLGAGMSHMVNVASGNSLLQWTPFSSPGRGISTLVNLTYNSLEDNNNSPLNSPAGNNFSLGISSLTRLGTMLDIHPNNADTIAGRANRWIAFVDGDGTRHRFEGRQATDGTVYWEEPAGVHLYLRQFSTTDATRKWALTRPDGVTFFFDADGHPTAVEDRNGNRLSFTLSNVDPGDDPGGPRKRVTAVVDAGGRAYEIDYYTKGEVQKAQLRGKVQRLTDHTGNALEFQYYEDGNLLRLTEKGGTKADGSFLADRTFVFTYTTSAGDGPAIPDANARVNPNPRTSPQSTRLYSVRDPRGNETRFAYYGPTSGQLRWKLASRTDRAGKATSYSYDLATRRTTVAAPMSRTTVYAYDAEGKVTGITNPKNETTTLSWTLDRHVSRITEPTTAYTEMAYNNNGYLTDVWDQLRNHTSMEYSNTTADANDVSGKWKAGRTTPHLSKLVKKTQPKGMATATPANDFQWSFSYDPKGNLTGVTDPEGKPTTYQRNPDGSIASVTSANSHTTSFTYEASGLVASITDAKSKVSRFGYDADGLLLWTQDANHQNDTGANPREYRTYFDYDSFGRLGRQSSPKSTGSERGTLVWQAVDFDANDNVELRIAPHFGVDYAGSGSRTTARYDPMDRVTLVTGPDTTADPAGERQTFTYDDAGRLATRTAPRGVQSTNTNQDFTDFFTYDGVDRVVKQARHEVDGNGAVVRTLYSHLCYDLAGDLRRAVSPRANVSTVDCNAALPQPFTTSYTYDVAHRRLTETDPLSHTRSQSYDAHNNVATSTDENGHVTTFTYDQRDLPVKMVEPFVTGTTPRNLTTRIEYDNVGNKKRLITPRAWDASSDKATFTQYVTTFQYDELDRLTRIDLPTSSTYSQQLYVHREYDPVGNMVTSTASDSSATLSLVPAAKKTVVAYFDTGWVRTTKEGTAARVHFDYTAEGQQSTRTPEGAGGVVDPSQKMVWSYYADGMLKENKDRNGHGTRYAYDADNNLTSAGGDSGVIDPRESRLDIEAVYDSLDRLSKARAKKQSETNWRFTRMEYDLNDNVANRFDDGVETTAGALVTSPRQVKFDYDGADWLTTMTDFGPSVDAVDDQVVETLFTATGKERDRKLFKKDALGNRVLNQQTTWEHFANGKLKTLVTKNGAGATLESHTVGYEDPAGIYVNGNRTKDTFTLAGPNTSAACRTTPCTATYTYDAQDRLVNENNGHGGVTNYTLDEAGNIKSEAVTRSGSTATETFEYSGNRLIRTSGVGAARRYHHDPDGNLDCVTTDTGSPSDCNTPTGQSVSPRLLADYHYDYLNRMDQYRSYTTNGTTSTADDSADYVLDALNRVVEQTETHSGTTRTTKFSYVGLSGQVSQETHSNATGVTATKTYGYDAFGHRITMGNDPGLPGPTGGSNEQFSYAYDVHGSVSLLVNGTGQARASYGYRPYGEKDTDLTKGDEVDDNPFNPYRYTAKRFDSGSGSLDMGARRFGPDINRFLQMDQYSGALADLRLGTDPLTGNRYGLAGGNPLSYIEWDGHVVYRDGEGAGSATPQETYQPTLAEIVTNPLYPLRPAPPPSFEEVQARAREYEEKQWLRDEIAKGNQTGDNGTQFRYYDIEKQPGRGQVQVDFFIRSRTSGLIIKGDSRGFTAERDKSSRVRIEFDFEQGYAKTTVFESCTSVALRCDEAEGVGGLINQVDVEEGSNGSITVKYDAANSITLGPSVDGRVTLLPRPDGRFNVRTHRDPYPSLEIYQYRGSRIDVLAREGQTYSLWGATPLSPDKREDHTPYQLT
jgi:RHS repeat-associated protein